MKILLDENIDVRLIKNLTEYDIFTVSQMGWLSMKNGELIKLAIENSFTHIVTLDKNIQFQQNLEKYKINFIIFDSFNSRLDTLVKFIPEFKNVLKNDPDKKITVLKI